MIRMMPRTPTLSRADFYRIVSAHTNSSSKYESDSHGRMRGRVF
jgi:hypothetical protein